MPSSSSYTYLSAEESEAGAWEALTGCFSEAAVEGLRSWVGDGARFMEAVWIVSASSRAGLDAILESAD